MVQKQLIYSIDSGVRNLPGSAGIRAECYRVGNWVYMAGQTGLTLDGQLVGVGDPAAQARQACENMKTLMELAGGTIDDIIKLTVYVTDRSYRHSTYPVIRSFFKEPRPCQTGIVVKGLAREELLIEIDAVGYIDDAE